MAASRIISMNHSSRYQRELESDAESTRFSAALAFCKQHDKDFHAWVKAQPSDVNQFALALYAHADELERDMQDAEVRATHESARP